MVPRNEKQSIKEKERKERNLINQGITVIYINKKKLLLNPLNK